MIFEPIDSDIVIVENKTLYLREKLAEIGLFGLDALNYREVFFETIKQTQQHLLQETNGTEVVILSDYSTAKYTEPILPSLVNVIKTQPNFEEDNNSKYDTLGVFNLRQIDDVYVMIEDDKTKNFDNFKEFLDNLVEELKNNL